MPFENSPEQFKPVEMQQAPHLAWQPTANDYLSSGTSAIGQRSQASSDLIKQGLLTDLQFDFGNTSLLAQAESSKLQQGYIAKTPDIDNIDLSQLNEDAQFGGAAGNWVRYLGRAAWHTMDALSQPGAADQSIFGSIVNAKHYYSENSLQATFNDISKLSEDARNVLWNVPSDLRRMTPEQKSKTSAELTLNAAFFFFGAKVPISEKVVELMELEQRTEIELRVLGIEKGTSQIGKDGVASSTLKGSEGLESYISRPINGADRLVPLGFKDEVQFFQAAHELSETLKDCGISDARLGVRGSSVTGYSDSKETIFHAESDIDFYVQSAQIANAFDGKTFINPRTLIGKFPQLKEWADRWQDTLGRPISPSAFAPDTLPPTPAINLEID